MGARRGEGDEMTRITTDNGNRAMTDQQFCEAIRLRSAATDAQRVDLLGLLMEAVDRLAQAADERDEAMKAARSIIYSVLCKEIPRNDICPAALAKWPWLKEGKVEL